MISYCNYTTILYIQVYIYICNPSRLRSTRPSALVGVRVFFFQWSQSMKPSALRCWASCEQRQVSRVWESRVLRNVASSQWGNTKHQLLHWWLFDVIWFICYICYRNQNQLAHHFAYVSLFLYVICFNWALSITCRYFVGLYGFNPFIRNPTCSPTSIMECQLQGFWTLLSDAPRGGWDPTSLHRARWDVCAVAFEVVLLATVLVRCGPGDCCGMIRFSGKFNNLTARSWKLMRFHILSATTFLG